MKTPRILKRALMILLIFSIIMSFFSIGILADSAANPDGTTTETTVITDTQSDTPLEGYTTETVTTTAVTTGTVTATGAAVNATVTDVITQVKDGDGFVRYSESCEQGDRTETLTAAVTTGSGPEVTLALSAGNTVTGSQTGSGASITAGDVKSGDDDPIYDYTVTTTGAIERTVSATEGEMTLTTNVNVLGSSLTENLVFNIQGLTPVAYEGKRHIYAPELPVPEVAENLGDGDYIHAGNPHSEVETFGWVVLHNLNNGIQKDDVSHQWVVWGNNGPVHTYCIDNFIGAWVNKHYTVENLMKDFYLSEEQVNKIRSIALHGYWGTESGLGSLTKFKQELIADMQAGLLPETVHVNRGSGGPGREWDFTIDEDFINGLTEGEFLGATRAALTTAGRGNFVCYFSPDNDAYDPYVYEDLHMERDVGEGRMKVAYEYLCALPDEPMSEDLIIDEQNFLDDDGLSLTIKNKVEGGTENTYYVDLSFTPIVPPEEDDDLVIQLLDGEENVIRFARLAGTPAAGEENDPNYCVLARNGDAFTFEDLELAENTDAAFKLALDGIQHIDQGTYIFRAQEGYDKSQTFIFVGEGDNLVDVDAAFSLRFSVTESAAQTNERHWRNESLTISVEKEWDNDSVSDRPESVTVQLYADGSPVEGRTVTLTAADNWAPKQFADLSWHVDGTGEEIQYSVQEVAGVELDSYTPSYGGSAGSGFIVTNTRNGIETTTITAVVHWDDANDQDGARSGVTATVQLYKTVNGVTAAVGDAVTVGHEQDWSTTWQDLPKYEGGLPIQYSVEETLNTPNGYWILNSNSSTVKRIDVAFGGTGEFTNKYEPEKTTITVIIHWDDANDRDGKRSGVGATVQLYKTVNGVTDAVGDAVEVGQDQDWTKTWENLPKNEGGAPIQYSVKETLNTPNEYTIVGGSTATPPTKQINVAYGGSGTITNHYDPETTSATVRKIWDDSGNQDGIRPTSLTVTLSNGTQVILNNANAWTATVENLPKNENGVEINYTWDEGEVEGYILSSTSVNGTTTTLTNKHEPEITTITVIIHWDDDNDRDGKRNDVIAKVKLFKTVDDVRTLVETVTVGSIDDWTKVWSDLYVYEGGKPVQYSVEETLETPNGYTIADSEPTTPTVKEIAVPNGGTGEITNHYEPEKTTITAVVHWDDANDQDGKRNGVTAKLRLYKTVDDVRTLVETVTVGSDDDWTNVWSGLYVYEGGKAIQYSVEETLETPNGYTIADSEPTTPTVKEIVVPNGETGEITNHYDPEATDITIIVHWDDNDDMYERRSSVVAAVQLYKTVDGVKTLVGDPVEVGHNQDWSKVWENLPKYEGGKLIQYSVEETLEDPNGYRISGAAEIPVAFGESGTITNRYRVAPPVTPPTPSTTSVTVSKVWNDEENVSGDRPASVTVILVRNGIDTAMRAVLSAANSWTYTFANLRTEDDAGIAYVYTVREEVPEGYTDELSGSAASGFVITNTKVEIPDDQPPLGPDDPNPKVPDEPTPLSPVPMTGDESRIFLWLGLGLTSLCGIAVLSRKRKEEEE